MHFKKTLLGFVLIILVIPTIFSADSLKITSPNYFGEQSNVFEEIHYLKDELLTFEFCTEETVENISAKIICESEEESLKLYKNENKKGCYFRNYDLSKSPCGEFSLEFNYEVDSKERKITRKFQEEKQSRLINHILSLDYESLDDDEVSYYLLVQNEVNSENSQISQNIYDTLKDSRDNDDKCWPDGSCDVETTSLILNNLKKAGYSLTSRLLEDGKLYLEKNLINNENNPLEFIINLDHDFGSNEEITCDLEIDDGNSTTYTYDEDNNDDIEDFASSSISFTCNSTVETINFDIYGLDSEILESEEYENETSFSYSITSFACSGEDDECDYESSIRNLDTYGSGFESNSLINNYLDSLIIEEDDEFKINSDEEYEDTGKYLSLKSNSDLVDFLKFNQNNDGSWGSGSRDSKIVETAWAVLGLEKSGGSSSEHLKDGKNWIYFEEPSSGWGSIEDNTLAYLAIKEQIKPYLKINSINEIENPTYFLITNPTIHTITNVEISVSENIKKHLSYLEDLGNLEGEGILPFNVTYSEPFFGTLTGEIKITGRDGKNNNLNLLTLPINLKGPSAFTIYSDNASINEESPNVNIFIKKNINTFSAKCSYENPFSKEIITQTITQADDSIQINNPSLLPGIFEIEMNCESDGNTFVLTTPINVTVAKVSFEILEEYINLTNIYDFSINVHSLLKDKQTLSFSVDGDFEGVIEPSEENKIIAANDTREVFFTITGLTFLEALGGTGEGNIIVTSESGYIQKIPILTPPGELSTEGGETTSIWYWVSIFFVILLIGFIILVIVRYFQLRNMHDDEGYENEDEMYFDDNVEFK